MHLQPLPPPAPPPGFVLNTEEGGYERRTLDGRLIIVDGVDAPGCWSVVVAWPNGYVVELYRADTFEDAMICAEVLL